MAEGDPHCEDFVDAMTDLGQGAWNAFGRVYLENVERRHCAIRVKTWKPAALSPGAALVMEQEEIG